MLNNLGMVADKEIVSQYEFIKMGSGNEMSVRYYIFSSRIQASIVARWAKKNISNSTTLRDTKGICIETDAKGWGLWSSGTISCPLLLKIYFDRVLICERNFATPPI